MSTIQDVRDELETLLDPLDVQVYAFLPGAATLPAIVIGLPDRIVPAVSAAYWRLELPVYVVARSADPTAQETSLLETLVSAVDVLRDPDNRTGSSYVSLRVEDVTELFQITVGSVEAVSAQVNLELMIPNPTA